MSLSDRYAKSSGTKQPEAPSLAETIPGGDSDDEDTKQAEQQQASEAEEPNLLLMRKIFNPYLKAWKDVTPLSMPHKAVWRYSPNSKSYEPHAWGQMALSTSSDQVWIQGCIGNVIKQVGSPPDSNFLWVVTCYFFLVHAPLVYLLTRYFFFENLGTDSNEAEVKKVTTIYFGAIILLTILLVSLHFVLRHKYKRVLLEHELKIQGVLDHFNTQAQMNNMRLAAGKFGAWIELQIFHPQYELVGLPSRESQELLYGSSTERKR